MTGLEPTTAISGDLTTSGVCAHLRLRALGSMAVGAFAMLAFSLVQLMVRDDPHVDPAGRGVMSGLFLIGFLLGAAACVGALLIYAASSWLASHVTAR